VLPVFAFICTYYTRPRKISETISIIFGNRFKIFGSCIKNFRKPHQKFSEAVSKIFGSRIKIFGSRIRNFWKGNQLFGKLSEKTMGAGYVCVGFLRAHFWSMGCDILVSKPTSDAPAAMFCQFDVKFSHDVA
jgi:hypothetical protein